MQMARRRRCQGRQVRPGDGDLPRHPEGQREGRRGHPAAAGAGGRLEHAVPVKQSNAVASTDAPGDRRPGQALPPLRKGLPRRRTRPGLQEPDRLGLPHGRRWRGAGRDPRRGAARCSATTAPTRSPSPTTAGATWNSVRTDVRYGSQDNQYDEDELQFFQNILMNGGVCGRRAFIGRFILRAFGIPTTARPQRGHAALVHWTPDGWVPCLGAGWGSGWTKTRYNKDLDFLANTQARATGEPFLQVKRAQWIGDVDGREAGLRLRSPASPASGTASRSTPSAPSSRPPRPRRWTRSARTSPRRTKPRRRSRSPR